MSDNSADSPVHIIGSRELHQSLPKILQDLEDPKTRYVLTVHGKPKAVLIGGEAFLNLVSQAGASNSEALVCLQLSAYLGPNMNGLVLEDLEKALASPLPLSPPAAPSRRKPK